MRRALALVLVLTVAAPLAAAPYYFNNFEKRLGIKPWVSTVKYDLRALRLVNEKAPGGKRCALIDYTVKKTGSYSYFHVPFEVPVKPGASYVVDGRLKVEAPEHANVALGIVWGVEYGGRSVSNCCYSVTPPVEKRGQWVRLLSKELAPALVDNIECYGFSPLAKQTFTGLYLRVLGRLKPGDRVRIYIDDLALTPATDDIRKRWKEEDRRARKELGYGASPVTPVEKSFRWGVVGSITGLARWIEIPPEVCATVVARDWKGDFYDSAATLGSRVILGRTSPEAEDRLQRTLDITARHGFRMQASIRPTGYSKHGAFDPNADRSRAEALIRRVITRLRNHPGVLAWYILDEPRPEWPALRDHWVWAKKRIEALDPRHPVTAAINNPRAIRFYSPWSAIMQIDWYPLSMRSGGDDGGVLRHGPLSSGARVRAAWRAGARTVWFIPQTYGDYRKRRAPTPAEARAQVYAALAHGATGIFLYQYQSRPVWHVAGGERDIADVVLARPLPMGREVTRLGQVVPIVGPTLVGTRWVKDSGVTTRSPILKGFGIPALQAQLNRGPDYGVVVAYNLNVDARQAGTVHLPEALLRGRTCLDLHARKPVTVDRTGAFPLELAPGDGRFFALATPDVAKRLCREMDQRLHAKLGRLYALELAEAKAVGVATRRAEDLSAEAARKVRSGVCAEGVARMREARETLRRALAADADYTRCLKRLAELQALVSAANAKFGDYALSIPWKRHTTEYAQPRRIAVARYKPHGDLILAGARHYFRLRYGLMRGKVAECEKALPSCRRLADQTQRLVDVLVSGKLHETPGMWQLYHPVTPRVRELLEQCDARTRALAIGP